MEQITGHQPITSQQAPSAKVTTDERALKIKGCVDNLLKDGQSAITTPLYRSFLYPPSESLDLFSTSDGRQFVVDCRSIWGGMQKHERKYCLWLTEATTRRSGYIEWTAHEWAQHPFTIIERDGEPYVIIGTLEKKILGCSLWKPEEMQPIFPDDLESREYIASLGTAVVDHSLYLLIATPSQLRGECMDKDSKKSFQIDLKQVSDANFLKAYIKSVHVHEGQTYVFVMLENSSDSQLVLVNCTEQTTKTIRSSDSNHLATSSSVYDPAKSTHRVIPAKEELGPFVETLDSQAAMTQQVTLDSTQYVAVLPLHISKTPSIHLWVVEKAPPSKYKYEKQFRHVSHIEFPQKIEAFRFVEKEGMPFLLTCDEKSRVNCMAFDHEAKLVSKQLIPLTSAQKRVFALLTLIAAFCAYQILKYGYGVWSRAHASLPNVLPVK